MLALEFPVNVRSTVPGAPPELMNFASVTSPAPVPDSELPDTIQVDVPVPVASIRMASMAASRIVLFRRSRSSVGPMASIP